MLDAVDRMRSLGKRSEDGGAPSSIFGSASSLAQSIETDERYRISIYPIVSTELPEVTMGLASCLAYLLEQYADTRVYRCFATISPDDESNEITSDDYQFTHADWELDGLADNVTLYGTLDTSDDSLNLRLTLDMSLLNADDVSELRYQFHDLTTAVSALPDIAAEIVKELTGQPSDQAIINYTALAKNHEELSPVLESLFNWNLDVYLFLWDVPWDDDDIRAQFLELAAYCHAQPSEFAYWCLGMMARQVMQAGIQDIGDIILPLLNEALDDESPSLPGRAAIALGFSGLEYHNRAISMLQPHLSPAVQAGIQTCMIEIFLAAGHFSEALDTSQAALENGNFHPALAWQYAQLLISAETNNWEIEEVLLIDPEDHAESDHIALEIASALKLYLGHNPHNLAALQLALFYMIDGLDDELWLYFERLVQSDMAGDFVVEVVDRLIDLDDYGPAYEILERHLDSNAYAYVLLGQLALATDDSTSALELVANCRSALSQVDDDLEIELQRLELAARLPEFAAVFAEVKVVLNAKRPVPNDHFEMLEAAVEIAPKMVDLYVILSRAYLSANDSDNALAVLQEAEVNAGVHPQIELALSQVLWSRNQKQDAISKLNEALRVFPSDVNLLAQMANYLIVNDQLNDARAYIARAETIAPSHRAIWQLRRLVAQRVAQ